MRSWTTFLVFGGLLLAFIIVYSINQQSTKANPVMVSAQHFIDAVKKNDANGVKALLDPNQTKLLAGENRIVYIWFADTGSLLPTAFAKQNELKWTYIELSGLKLDLNAKPDVINDIAKAPLTSGRSMYLHRIGDAWKISYITK